MHPFRIQIPDAELEDLRARLRRTRWPEPATADGWTQGVPLDYLRELCAYWAEAYDWRATEARLNDVPQFRAEIDGVGIHLLHVRSPEPGAMPLVITHGWPGSVVEFLKAIGPLSDPAAHGGDPADAFHVVCPAPPGYGFSDKPAQTGWGVERIARAWCELMSQLGYERFGAQGSDWGTSISTSIAQQAPDRVIGLHLTLPWRRRTRPPLTISPRASEPRWTHWPMRTASTPATRVSTPPGRRRSAMRWSTRRRRCARGSLRSSGDGPTMMVRSRPCSPVTRRSGYLRPIPAARRRARGAGRAGHDQRRPAGPRSRQPRPCGAASRQTQSAARRREQSGAR